MNEVDDSSGDDLDLDSKLYQYTQEGDLDYKSYNISTKAPDERRYENSKISADGGIKQCWGSALFLDVPEVDIFSNKPKDHPKLTLNCTSFTPNPKSRNEIQEK